jgi:DNA-binding CsgD family transcriptional regulator
MKRLFQARDELSLRHIRPERWCALLLFPLTIIAGDVRTIDIGFSLLGYETKPLIFVCYGLGWLVFLFLPPRLIPSVFKGAAVVCAALLSMQFLLPPEDGSILGLSCFFAFHFSNGVCAAVGLFSYMFALRNAERLIGILLLELWFIVVDDLLWELPGLPEFMGGGGAAIFAALLIVLAFSSGKEDIPIQELRAASAPDQKKGIKQSGYLIFFCDICYFAVGTLHYYLEYTDTYEFTSMFAIASLVGIGVLLILLLRMGRSAIQLWNLFFVLALIAFACQFANTPTSVNVGAFFYGFGDAIGYIMVQYMIGCVGRRNRSVEFFRVACIIAFVEYAPCTILLDSSFMLFPVPDQVTAFAIVTAVVCIGLMMTPVLVKRFFDTDWSEEFQALDMSVYAEQADRASNIDRAEGLGLTPREKEIFTLLLTDMPQKELAATLKISMGTVGFHSKNLYRKLGIQSRTELFTRYSGRFK